MFVSPFQVVNHLPLTPGMRVGDFGAGSGEYSFLIREKLQGEGGVYTFDIDDGYVSLLERERVKRNIDNFFSMCVDLNQHLPLRDRLLHCAVVANTLHALQNREQFLGELNRVLEFKGTVLFVDWASSFRNMGPSEENVITPGEAVRLFEAHGFKVGDMLPSGTHHFAFIATKI